MGQNDILQAILLYIILGGTCLAVFLLVAELSNARINRYTTCKKCKARRALKPHLKLIASTQKAIAPQTQTRQASEWLEYTYQFSHRAVCSRCGFASEEQFGEYQEVQRHAYDDLMGWEDAAHDAWEKHLIEQGQSTTH